MNALAVMAIVYRGDQLALHDRDHIYAALGDKNSAFEFLEKVFQEKPPDIAYFLKAELWLDALRSDPRFQDLVGRVGLPQ